MALLQCEICGGKLTGRAGGIYECDFCGMQYDAAWAKTKIQEIKGTVKVEGTVQIAGTVKIDDGIDVAKTIQYGWTALEDMDWPRASACFDKVIDQEPENAEAYLGRLMAKKKERRRGNLSLYGINMAETPEGRAILRYGSGEIKELMQKLDADYQAEARKRQLERERRQAQERQEEEQARRKEEQEHQRKIQKLQQMRPLIQPVQNMVQHFTKNVVIAMSEDGTLRASEDYYFEGPDSKRRNMPNLKQFTDVVAFQYPYILSADGTLRSAQSKLYMENVKSICGAFVVRYDGSVRLIPEKKTSFGVQMYSDEFQNAAESLENISLLMHNGNTAVGLRRDGTVISTDEAQNSTLMKWKDIVSVSMSWEGVLGLRKDGTIAVLGYEDEAEILSTWTDIVSLHDQIGIVGLRKDGTVVSTLRDDWGKDPFASWKYVMAIYQIGGVSTIGLPAEGPMYNYGKSPSEYWGADREETDVVAIHDLGGTLCFLKSNGNVHVVNKTWSSISSGVNRWYLFGDIQKVGQNIEKRRMDAQKIAQDRQKAYLDRLKKEKTALQAELPHLKGIFAKRRRGEIEARLTDIEKELRGSC